MSSKYTKGFYQNRKTSSALSASIVVPLVLSEFKIRSVVDFGCGDGGWLKVFQRHGINDYLGIDGDYVPISELEIPTDKFFPQDLTAIGKLGKSFDLSCSLEVAEHLPFSCARKFVSTLVDAAPIVLFSAAVPGQGGVDHVNEQWQSFWAELFHQHDYVAIDCIRPKIYYNVNVQYWYRQNIIVYCRSDHRQSHHIPISDKYSLDRIHPEFVANVFTGPKTGRAALSEMVRAAKVLIKSAF